MPYLPSNLLCAMFISLPAVTTQPADRAPATQPAPEEVGVRIRDQARWASYWLLRPEGYQRIDRPAVLIVLHGTDDTARDALDFWSVRRHELPLLIVAPQAVDKGWRDEDLPALRETLADLRQRAPFDENRLLLAGFSAGGSMVMHLLYAENWPVCAAAALANYVPPPLTPEQIRPQRHVPVFYAVGMTDINHDRMRVGLDLLRSCGASIDLYRPPIGHVLDPQVGQAALDWLLLRARRSVTARIDAVKDKPSLQSSEVLEEIAGQARWHDRANADAATRALEAMESPGRQRLERARLAAENQRPLDALETLEGAEADCISRRLRVEVGQMREMLLADPQVKMKWDQLRRQHRDEEAFQLYVAAQRSVADRRYRDALGQCEAVMQRYADTPAAQRARFLADLLRDKKLAE